MEMELLLLDAAVLGALGLLIRFGGLESVGVLGYGGVLYGLWFFGFWRGVAVWLALLGVCVAIDVVAWIRRRRKAAAADAVEPPSEEPGSVAGSVVVALAEAEGSAA